MQQVSQQQILRLYKLQNLSTSAPRSLPQMARLHSVLTGAFGAAMGDHFLYKLVDVENGNVISWLLTLDEENSELFWSDPMPGL